MGSGGEGVVSGDHAGYWEESDRVRRAGARSLLSSGPKAGSDNFCVPMWGQTQAFATVIELPASLLAPKAGILAASGAEP